MNREDSRMAGQERELLDHIKKLALDQKLDQCNSKAKELIRLRAQRERISSLKSHMSGIGNQLTFVQTGKVMQDTLASTLKAMQYTNHAFDAAATHRMLHEFERQNDILQTKSETIDDTLDGMFETFNEKSTTDDMIASILQEIGIGDQTCMAKVKIHENTSCEDLETRLNKLRN